MDFKQKIKNCIIKFDPCNIMPTFYTMREKKEFLQYYGYDKVFERLFNEIERDDDNFYNYSIYKKADNFLRLFGMSFPYKIQLKFNRAENEYIGRLLSKNPNVTWEFVQAHPYIEWNYRLLSTNYNITWDIILQNLHFSWDFNLISENPNITWDIICRYPQYFYNCCVSLNPNITWDIVMANLYFPWDFNLLSLNPNITMDIVLHNLYFPWNFRMLLQNKNITMEVLRKNIIYFFNMYEYFSLNPNVTNQMIIEHSNFPWYPANLIKNYSVNHTEFEIDQHYTPLILPMWIHERCHGIREHYANKPNAIIDIYCNRQQPRNESDKYKFFSSIGFYNDVIFHKLIAEKIKCKRAFTEIILNKIRCKKNKKLLLPTDIINVIMGLIGGDWVM